INNIAIAAEYLLQEKGAKKIAIIDLDLHHGNGTQEIFWNRGEVSYISIHQAPFYPGTGALYEIGGEGGEGATLNLPIPSFSGDQAYKTLVSEIIIPYLNDQKPEILLISFGFDTHWRDPLGSMQVSGNCIYRMLIDFRLWAEKHCSGRVAVLLEGGYDLEAGRISGQAVGAALVDQPWEDPLGNSPIDERDVWQETLNEAKDFWGY
ncbi:MAG: histone deacetylase, partial [Anaerolineales bacterium]|nr:histone deacetylase [Anaerolineales bacterium]